MNTTTVAAMSLLFTKHIWTMTYVLSNLADLLEQCGPETMSQMSPDKTGESINDLILQFKTEIQNTLDILSRARGCITDTQVFNAFLAQHLKAARELIGRMIHYQIRIDGLKTENMVPVKKYYESLIDLLHSLIREISGKLLTVDIERSCCAVDLPGIYISKWQQLQQIILHGKFTGSTFKSMAGRRDSDTVSSGIDAWPLPGKKIQFLAPVPELALFMKTAMEAGIIEPMTPMDLAVRCGAVFNTIGATENSINSLRNHFFNPKKAAAVSLIDKLHKWIHILRKYQ